MKPLSWIGLLLLGLGLASFFVALPHKEREGFKAGPISVGVETTHDEKVSPFVSAAFILTGAGLLIAGTRR